MVFVFSQLLLLLLKRSHQQTIAKLNKCFLFQIESSKMGLSHYQYPLVTMYSRCLSEFLNKFLEKNWLKIFKYWNSFCVNWYINLLSNAPGAVNFFFKNLSKNPYFRLKNNKNFQKSLKIRVIDSLIYPMVIGRCQSLKIDNHFYQSMSFF